MMKSLPLMLAGLILAIAAHCPPLSTQSTAVTIPAITIPIDAGAPAHPFPHFWEQMFGSGHAVLALRDNYRLT